MKSYIVKGIWEGYKSEEEVLVYTKQDTELKEIFDRDVDWSQYEVNPILKRIGKIDDDFLCYIELENENDIEALKKELNDGWNFQVEEVE